jgi:hypothetical protein
MQVLDPEVGAGRRSGSRLVGPQVVTANRAGAILAVPASGGPVAGGGMSWPPSTCVS